MQSRIEKKFNQSAQQTLKIWFEGSSVINENGHPKKLFHATENSFDANDFHPFSHFGTKDAAIDRMHNKGVSERKTSIIPVYLNIKNPLRIKDFLKDNLTRMASAFDDLSYEQPEMEDLFIEISEYLTQGADEMTSTSDTLEQERITKEYKTDLISMLEEQGYDGLIYENLYEDIGHDSYIIFSPKQVYPLVEEIMKPDVGKSAHNSTQSKKEQKP